MLLEKKRNKFRRVASFVRPDSKKRIALGKALISNENTCYNVYSNDLGEIVLEPIVGIPANEAWIFKNKHALDSLKKGIDESSSGNVESLGSFASFAE